MLAATYGHCSTVELLLDRGAAIGAVSKVSTALFPVFGAGSSVGCMHRRCAEMLISASVSAEDAATALDSICMGNAFQRMCGCANIVWTQSSCNKGETAAKGQIQPCSSLEICSCPPFIDHQTKIIW